MQATSGFRILPMMTALVSCLTAITSSESYAVDNLATPTGEVVVSGSSSFDRPAPGQLNVTQNSSRTVINWQSFDIGEGAKTEFFQPGASALAVNRVSSGDPVQILGTLKSNGQLMILDRNGVMFGEHATIKVGGIVAAAGDVDNAQVMSGSHKIDITNMGPGTVENRGSITVADMGLAALVAPTVKNSGTITASLGRVGMGAGEKVTVDFFGDDLISVAADSHLAHAIVTNSGTINAQGGKVVMTASAASGVLNSAVNNSGLVNASSATMRGGKIVLSASGSVSNHGKLKASGLTGGGKINIKARDIDSDGEINVEATGPAKGGHIEMFADRNTLINGVVKASGQAGGGNIEVRGENITVDNSGYAVAEATVSGLGGHIDLFGGDSTTVNSVVKASGISGGGNIEMRGADIVVDNDGYVVAEANGMAKGGHVDIFSDNSAVIDGVVKATGKGGGGNIEVRGGKVTVNGTAVAEGTVAGEGGHIDLVGGSNTTINGTLKASGKTGGGHIKARGDEIDTSSTAVVKSGDGSIRFIAGTLTDLDGGYFGADHFNITSPAIDFSGDIHVSNADLVLDTSVVNLDALILNSSGSNPILDPSRFISNAPVVNVLSDNAMIQQGIYVAASGAVVTVDNGNYIGSFTIDRSLTLQGDGSLPHVTVSAPSAAIATVAADDVTIRGLDFDGMALAGAGLMLTGNDGINISGNTFRNNTTGIDASVFGNGDIALSGNRFVGNTTGANFGSGLIDLTGASNTFIGGDVALLFSRAMAGPVPADLTLVNDTLGQTIFEGQNTFYVELGNGAFFEPGEPTLINGFDSFWDGVKGSNLTPAQLAAVEVKLHDYDDDKTLGQIFERRGGGGGGGGSTGVDEDQLERIQRPSYFRGRALVVLTGLPHVTGAAFAPAGFNNMTAPNSPEALANIQPAAGGPDKTAANTAAGLGSLKPGAGEVTGTTRANTAEDLAHITPPSGAVTVNSISAEAPGNVEPNPENTVAIANPANLADIEPAAGGTGTTAVPCWDNVRSAAAAGTVSLDLSSSGAETLLAAQAACPTHKF